MLVLIPILAYVGIYLFLDNFTHQCDWRRASLRAALVWATYLVVLTEVLSLVEAVTPLGLSLGWLIPLISSAGWLVRSRRGGTKLKLPICVVPKAWPDRLLLVGVSIILVITAYLAWHTPPQTWDSLNYHLSRVAHWAQEALFSHSLQE